MLVSNIKLKGENRMLTEQQIEKYHKDGYLVLPDLYTAEECEFMKNYGSKLWDERGTFHLKNLCLEFDDINQIAVQDKMKTIVNQLSGNRDEETDVAIMSDVLLYRPGNQPEDHESLVHQDYTCSVKIQPHDCKMVACVMFDDADMENGCLWYYAGSHKEGELGYITTTNSRYYIDDGKDVELVEKYGEKIYEVCKAGTVIMHDIWSVHGAVMNTSDKVRQSWIVNYIIQDIYEENNGSKF